MYSFYDIKNSLESISGRFDFKTDCGDYYPVSLSGESISNAVESIFVEKLERLSVLNEISKYKNVHDILNGEVTFYAKKKSELIRKWLSDGVYLFGAYKVGVKVEGIARESNINVIGFLDNDPSKSGTFLNGKVVNLPSNVNLEGAVVVLASGQHSNAIHEQLNLIPRIRIINLHEFLYALNAFHITEEFKNFVNFPIEEPYKFVSAFLRLDDERSRIVFDSLIGMRTRLSISPAIDAKSTYKDEYFELDFVSPESVRRFVDGGAATGDTLQRLEGKFGKVEQAWLFEPEIQAYYEALKYYSDRPEVLVFNMGLDEAPSKFPYDPCLTFDVANEVKSAIPPYLKSYIQGVPLDSVINSNVSFIKLDIEGMESKALSGSKEIIKKNKPILAICAYHRSNDFWSILDQVLSIRSDYRVGMRLYSDILEDSTFYFY